MKKWRQLIWSSLKALLPSTRNSDDAFLHLLKATECNKFICGPERKARVLDVKKLRPDLEVIEIPSLAEMLASETQHYPYNRTYEEAEDEPCLIIHSSGTTGMYNDMYIYSLIQKGTPNPLPRRNPKACFPYAWIRSLSWQDGIYTSPS